VEFTDIKAPEPVHGMPPWHDPRWLADAEKLDRSQLCACQAKANQPSPRTRPVMRIENR
jgi:hypothetical protein